MLQATITAIRMLIAADPEADDATINRVVEACKPVKRRDLVTSKEACTMLGGITRMTLHKWTKRGMLHPVRFSSRNLKFDRAEIENLANNGAQ